MKTYQPTHFKDLFNKLKLASSNQLEFDEGVGKNIERNKNDLIMTLYYFPY
ncbi:hypothetical protein Fmac_031042 [Flemingia macrophylla]|uniref:Uncharacterized protein n=1 Tax=Flemingia macrophylla TaxID=520843 RepID=A0ABD1L0X3_9FABA